MKIVNSLLARGVCVPENVIAQTYIIKIGLSKGA